MSSLNTLLRTTELLSWVAGITLVGFFLAQVVQGEVRRVQDLQQVELAWAPVEPDTSLWSPGRIAAWEQSRAAAPANLMAVLAMPGVDLEVPVYIGASDLNMDRGAGLIEGTARPGEAGNVGIAGHRDGYFRALKDTQLGDSLLLRTAQGVQRYTVDEILIVDPIDVEVLDPTDESRVTLVTCYPFYFVGSAPQRFIVRAQLDETPPTL